jgi:hypothetical protein
MPPRKPILEGITGEMKEGFYRYVRTIRPGIALFESGEFGGQTEIFVSLKSGTTTEWHLHYNRVDWEFLSTYVPGAGVPDMREHEAPYTPSV